MDRTARRSGTDLSRSAGWMSSLGVFHRNSIDPDAALVAQLRRTDTGAAEALVGTYGDRVYRLAIRITGNASDAEEVVQDAFWSVQKHRNVPGRCLTRLLDLPDRRQRRVSERAPPPTSPRRDLFGGRPALVSRQDGRHAGPISDWSRGSTDPAAQTRVTCRTERGDRRPASRVSSRDRSARCARFFDARSGGCVARSAWRTPSHACTEAACSFGSA